MVNFVLFHKGKLPHYINECINQIQHTQTNYSIYLLTDDSRFTRSDINIVNINDIDCCELQSLSFYANNNDPLWRTSFERFFYIKKIIYRSKLENIIHFDNDVLIYKNINEIINVLCQHIPHIGLPMHKPNEFVCGFMYIKDFLSIDRLCNALLSIAQKGEKALEVEFNSWPHEMRLLGHVYHTVPKLITPLPILPSNEWTNLYELLQGVFDPSSYGQYFGETGQKPQNTVHPNDINRYIDRHIINNNILPIFKLEDRKPYIHYKDKHIPIFNLHIHSKALIDFCTFRS
jgi:hypothetical protein